MWRLWINFFFKARFLGLDSLNFLWKRPLTFQGFIIPITLVFGGFKLPVGLTINSINFFFFPKFPFHQLKERHSSFPGLAHLTFNYFYSPRFSKVQVASKVPPPRVINYDLFRVFLILSSIKLKSC